MDPIRKMERGALRARKCSAPRALLILKIEVLDMDLPPVACPQGGGAGGYGPQIYIQGKLSDSGYRRWMDWYSNRHIYCVKPNRFAKFYAKISIV